MSLARRRFQRRETLRRHRVIGCQVTGDGRPNGGHWKDDLNVFSIWERLCAEQNGTERTSALAESISFYGSGTSRIGPSLSKSQARLPNAVQRRYDEY